MLLVLNSQIIFPSHPAFPVPNYWEDSLCVMYKAINLRTGVHFDSYFLLRSNCNYYEAFKSVSIRGSKDRLMEATQMYLTHEPAKGDS